MTGVCVDTAVPQKTSRGPHTGRMNDESSVMRTLVISNAW